MTTCTDCATARLRTWGQYSIPSCNGCVARSIARSLVAFEALKHGATSEALNRLREVVARRMPRVATDQARKLVGDWWRHDHPTTEGAK